MLKVENVKGVAESDITHISPAQTITVNYL